MPGQKLCGVMMDEELARPDRVTLPEGLSLGGLSALQQTIMNHRSKPLEIDASSITRVGALGLQLLISASRQWKEDGVPFQIIGTPTCVTDACRVLGIPLMALGIDQNERDIE